MFEECFQHKSVQSGTSKVSVTVTVNICMMATVVSEAVNNKLNKLTKI